MSKLPAKWPTFIVKCMWRSTAISLKFQAKNEAHALDLAAKQIRKMDGGAWVQEIKITGKV